MYAVPYWFSSLIFKIKYIYLYILDIYYNIQNVFVAYKMDENEIGTQNGGKVGTQQYKHVLCKCLVSLYIC